MWLLWWFPRFYSPSFLTIPYRFPWCFRMFPLVFLRFPRLFLLSPVSVSPFLILDFANASVTLKYNNMSLILESLTWKSAQNSSWIKYVWYISIIIHSGSLKQRRYRIYEYNILPELSITSLFYSEHKKLTKTPQRNLEAFTLSRVIKPRTQVTWLKQRHKVLGKIFWN